MFMCTQNNSISKTEVLTAAKYTFALDTTLLSAHEYENT